LNEGKGAGTVGIHKKHLALELIVQAHRNGYSFVHSSAKSLLIMQSVLGPVSLQSLSRETSLA
jgi:hypothetical protein